MERSPNWRGGAFDNPVLTHKSLPGSFWRSLRLQLSGSEQRVPPAPLPIRAMTPADATTLPRSGLRVTWFGHSTALLDLDGLDEFDVTTFDLDNANEAVAHAATNGGPFRRTVIQP